MRRREHASVWRRRRRSERRGADEGMEVRWAQARKAGRDPGLVALSL